MKTGTYDVKRCYLIQYSEMHQLQLTDGGVVEDEADVTDAVVGLNLDVDDCAVGVDWEAWADSLGAVVLANHAVVAYRWRKHIFLITCYCIILMT